MAALAERRIIPHEELKARAEEKSEARAQERNQERNQERSQERAQELVQELAQEIAQERTPEHAAEQAQAEDEAVESAEQQPAVRPEYLRLLEALLFAASAPLDEKTLGSRLPEDVDVRQALRALQMEYAPRGVNLVKINNKWTFRTAADLSWLLTKEAIVPKKLSRAAVETLAVIAYHQPVTRAEVEEIRGVVMSKGTFDVLMETGWIKPRGRRKVPGRPITYGTTEDFLSHFGLEVLGDLPGLEELKGSGLLDHRLPPGFAVPMPSDDPQLRDDEDPLEPGDLDLGLAPPPERVEE
ncbi:MAG: SMC-Scp complex subunit ScpB [Xanthobacteraceae bacterium]|nr:SMC-Scp complex subunit ScpB [Xanthobacteraceae bacterium]MBX9844724.1 SMC-Scp complex subunit ScpB [Xanthobacteraceae bacterium]